MRLGWLRGRCAVGRFVVLLDVTLLGRLEGLPGCEPGRGTLCVREPAELGLSVLSEVPQKQEGSSKAEATANPQPTTGSLQHRRRHNCARETLIKDAINDMRGPTFQALYRRDWNW